MSDSSNPGQSVPSEFRISKKWDEAIERGIVCTVAGAVFTGLASVVLFRTKQSRLAFGTFGIGCGAGYAFKSASFEFEKEKAT